MEKKSLKTVKKNCFLWKTRVYMNRCSRTKRAFNLELSHGLSHILLLYFNISIVDYGSVMKIHDPRHSLRNVHNKSEYQSGWKTFLLRFPIWILLLTSIMAWVSLFYATFITCVGLKRTYGFKYTNYSRRQSYLYEKNRRSWRFFMWKGNQSILKILLLWKTDETVSHRMCNIS